MTDEKVFQILIFLHRVHCAGNERLLLTFRARFVLKISSASVRISKSKCT